MGNVYLTKENVSTLLESLGHSEDRIRNYAYGEAVSHEQAGVLRANALLKISKAKSKLRKASNG